MLLVIVPRLLSCTGNTQLFRRRFQAISKAVTRHRYQLVYVSGMPKFNPLDMYVTLHQQTNARTCLTRKIAGLWNGAWVSLKALNIAFGLRTR